MQQKAAITWKSINVHKNVACHAGSTISLVAQPVKADEQSKYIQSMIKTNKNQDPSELRISRKG